MLLCDDSSIFFIVNDVIVMFLDVLNDTLNVEYIQVLDLVLK